MASGWFGRMVAANVETTRRNYFCDGPFGNLFAWFELPIVPGASGWECGRSARKVGGVGHVQGGDDPMQLFLRRPVLQLFLRPPVLQLFLRRPVRQPICLVRASHSARRFGLGVREERAEGRGNGATFKEEQPDAIICATTRSALIFAAAPSAIIFATTRSATYLLVSSVP